MESNEVSIHQLKIYDFIASQPGWITAADVARGAAVAARTARAHCLKLVHLGILDQAEVFPAHRYRVSEFAGKRNKSYIQRLERARSVFAPNA